jgi:hypothetical protein
VKNLLAESGVSGSLDGCLSAPFLPDIWGELNILITKEQWLSKGCQ